MQTQQKALSGAYVVTKPIPGFRVGTVIDVDSMRAAFYLTPEDKAVLEIYSGHLASHGLPVGPEEVGAHVR